MVFTKQHKKLGNGSSKKKKRKERGKKVQLGNLPWKASFASHDFLSEVFSFGICIFQFDSCWEKTNSPPLPKSPSYRPKNYFDTIRSGGAQMLAKCISLSLPLTTGRCSAHCQRHPGVPLNQFVAPAVLHTHSLFKQELGAAGWMHLARWAFSTSDRESHLCDSSEAKRGHSAIILWSILWKITFAKALNHWGHNEKHEWTKWQMVWDVVSQRSTTLARSIGGRRARPLGVTLWAPWRKFLSIYFSQNLPKSLLVKQEIQTQRNQCRNTPWFPSLLENFIWGFGFSNVQAKACKCLLVQECHTDAEGCFQRNRVHGLFKPKIPGDDTVEVEFLGKRTRFISDFFGWTGLHISLPCACRVMH